ncbi:hypothetical protein [Streptomyces sp. NBC_00344]|uniref:hypothetical protein n=1 Tax=Streptomyces sp. NBC_00344 TaxID=2975720 RepID=UPI002E24B321
MTGNVKIGVALVGGYLLGRTKKAKMAIGLGMFLAGKKLSLDPAQLGKLVANSPVLGSLNNQVRTELVEATKSAATSALTKRASGLADSLHERTLGLGGAAGQEDREEEPEDDRDTEHAAEDDQEPEKKPAPRKRAAGSAAKSASGKASSGARRAASGGSRKAASSARQSASGAGKSASRTRTAKSGGAK